MENVEENIKVHISKNEIEKAFEKAKKWAESDSYKAKIILFIEAAHRRNESNRLHGTITREQYEVELTKISVKLIQFIEGKTAKFFGILMTPLVAVRLYIGLFFLALLMILIYIFEIIS